MKYFAQVAYDGGNYHGFQIQPNSVTIQLKIEQSLERIFKQEIRINYAGRTDSGVHALAQFIDFKTERYIEPDNLINAMNSLLPKDIRVVSLDICDDIFHSRFSAVWREYTYFICNKKLVTPFEYRYCWHIPNALNIDKMKELSKYLVGEQDYSFLSNEKKGKNCVRTVKFLRIKKFKQFIVINMRSNGFLRGMVRNTVGMLVAYSKNSLKINFIDNILSKDNKMKSLKAPSCGLFLTKVMYDLKELE